MQRSSRTKSETVQDSTRLHELISEWRSRVGLLGEFDDDKSDHDYLISPKSVTLGPPASELAISRWEETHGYPLPFGLRQWLQLSDGLVINGIRWIHPLRCIGPAVRFRPNSRLLQQPASWYEFGNPHDSPVNMDLIVAPKETDANTPIFVIGDEVDENSFRIIAHHFTEWFDRLIRSGFERGWSFDSASALGDPIAVHFANMKPPKLPPNLCKLCTSVGEQLSSGIDERDVMREHRLNRDELEQIITAYQYRLQKSASR